MMSQAAYKKTFWILLAICALTLLPFIGLSDFHTKGEPREAVVAYSMIEQNDWILPRNNGGEIPYKPPFFHWCIAAVSMLLNGGEVNEAMSRLPSAISLIATIMGCFVFYARHVMLRLAIVTALIAFTTFELHRAGENCRVDMVLTALTVLALFCFYRWYDRGLHGIPWIAILLMSCATLTKGPVGSIIPCLVTGVFLIIKRVKLWTVVWKLSLCGILSLILPVAWYIAAYNHGGKEFFDLVLEENLRRMTNTMSYDSCVNPWYFNLVTMVGGFAPWTLFAVISLFSLHYHRFSISRNMFSTIGGSIKRMSSVDMFSLTAIVVIFLFYCFPQSKRSVYLMPIYPFTAYFLAKYSFYLVRNGAKAVKIYGGILATVCILLPIVLITLKLNLIPDSIFEERHAAFNIAVLHALGEISGIWKWILIAITTFTGIGWWIYSRKKDNRNPIYGILVVTLALYLSLDGVYQPTVLNIKSKKTLTEEIDRIAPESKGKLYEFISEGVFSAGDPIHFFEINFYLGNRIGNFYKTRPDEGFLLVFDYDALQYFPEFAKEGYKFEPVYKSSDLSDIHNAYEVYRFKKETSIP